MVLLAGGAATAAEGALLGMILGIVQAAGEAPGRMAVVFEAIHLVPIIYHDQNAPVSRQLGRPKIQRYSGAVGTGASAWDAMAERSMAMAAYAMTAVTTQRISVR
jgi:hypothetical protein